MDNDLKELFPEFLEEAFDSISRVQNALDLLQKESKDVQSFEEVLRGIHTIKGGCGMFGLKEAKDCAHVLEAELQAYRNNLDALDLSTVQDYQRRVEELEKLLRPDDLKKEKNPVSSLAHKVSENSQKTQTNKTPNDQPKKIISSKNEPHHDENNHIQEVLRVPVNLVGDTLNGIWEVFLIRNQMSYLFDQQKETFKNNIEFLQNWEMLDSSLKKNISELESLVMAMRMSSVKNLFSRMEKVVDAYVASNPHKKIHFVTEGKNTELDKKVIDMLGEPLIHLVRNAMDHGVEDSEDRKNKGKPEIGTIVLSAETNTDRVIIKIKDDGKGIDSTKLIEKAKQKNLDVSDYEKGIQNPINIIFMPGFSTADKVTDVSGRGVGMDAVRHSLHQLGGNVSIETEVALGSTFSITLPLSLSVITSTVFKINNQSYGTNVNTILEICRTPTENIHLANEHLHFEYRGKFITCYDLRDYVSTSSKCTTKVGHEYTLLVINYKQDLLALIVDQVEQNMEVIVKPLPPTVPKINFVNGMSILPTGRAIFILMLENLVDMITSQKELGKELYAS